MAKLTGSKTVVSQGAIRRGVLTANRNAAGRIYGVSLTVDGIGDVSFAHITNNTEGRIYTNAAERLEALRGQACPWSAVRIRRAERDAVSEYTDTAGV